MNSSALGVSHEVGIHTNWLRAEDLYVILDQVDGNKVYFKVLVKPLVNLHLDRRLSSSSSAR